MGSPYALDWPIWHFKLSLLYKTAKPPKLLQTILKFFAIISVKGLPPGRGLLGGGDCP